MLQLFARLIGIVLLALAAGSAALAADRPPVVEEPVAPRYAEAEGQQARAGVPPPSTRGSTCGRRPTQCGITHLICAGVVTSLRGWNSPGGTEHPRGLHPANRPC